MVKNDKDNNININKDDLFNLIINNSSNISEEFYKILEQLELLYTQKILLFMQQDNIEKLKQIIFSLYEIYNSNLQYILHKIYRESLIRLYNICEMNAPSDLQNYFRKAVINNYF